jgi:hypothetical protein
MQTPAGAGVWGTRKGTTGRSLEFSSRSWRGSSRRSGASDERPQPVLAPHSLCLGASGSPVRAEFHYQARAGDARLPKLGVLAVTADSGKGSLSVRSVIDQLEIAIKLGWLTKTFARNERMEHKGNVYRLIMPSIERRSAVDSGKSGERPSPVGASYPQKESTAPSSGEPDAQSGERGSSSGERRSESVEPEVCKSLNSEADFSQTAFKQINKQLLNKEPLNFSSSKSKTDQKSNFKTAEQWGDELGVTRFVGERELDYKLRVLKAREAHRAKQAVR